jgi:hypothetical protein
LLVPVILSGVRLGGKADMACSQRAPTGSQRFWGMAFPGNGVRVAVPVVALKTVVQGS